MTEEDVLSSYETILNLTRAMVTSARNRDWQRLESLERLCRPVTGRLMSSEREVSLSPEGAQRKFQYLRQILEEDGAIRRETEPWMTRLSQLLHANDREQKLNSTYHAGQF
jgi:flagellar protein FliT